MRARTREQISSEMWEQINRLYLFVQSDSGEKLLRLQSVRIFQAHRRRLASFPRHHRCDDDARRRLGLHSHRDACSSGPIALRASSTVKYHILLPSGESVGGNVDTDSMDGGAEIVQRARGLSQNLCEPGGAVEGRGIPHHPCRISRARSVSSVDSLDAALHRISGVDESRTRTRRNGSQAGCAPISITSRSPRSSRFGLHEYLESHPGAARGSERSDVCELLREPGRPLNLQLDLTIIKSCANHRPSEATPGAASGDTSNRRDGSSSLIARYAGERRANA